MRLAATWRNSRHLHPTVRGHDLGEGHAALIPVAGVEIEVDAAAFEELRQGWSPFRRAAGQQ